MTGPIFVVARRVGLAAGPPRRVGGRMSGRETTVMRTLRGGEARLCPPHVFGVPVQERGAQTLNTGGVHQGAGFGLPDPCDTDAARLARIIGSDGDRLMARHAGLLLWPASPGAVPTIAALAPTGWGQMGVPWGQTVLTAWADTIDDSLFPGGACGGRAVHPALLRDGTRRVLSLERCGLNRHRTPGGRGQDVEIRRPAITDTGVLTGHHPITSTVGAQPGERGGGGDAPIPDDKATRRGAQCLPPLGPGALRGDIPGADVRAAQETAAITNTPPDQQRGVAAILLGMAALRLGWPPGVPFKTGLREITDSWGCLEIKQRVCCPEKRRRDRLAMGLTLI